jgi:hypothetical protein
VANQAESQSFERDHNVGEFPTRVMIKSCGLR